MRLADDIKNTCLHRLYVCLLWLLVPSAGGVFLLSLWGKYRIEAAMLREHDSEGFLVLARYLNTNQKTLAVSLVALIVSLLLPLVYRVTLYVLRGKSAFRPRAPRLRHGTPGAGTKANQTNDPFSVLGVPRNATAVPASVGLRYLAKIVDLVVVLGPAFLIATIDEATGGFIIIFGWLTYNWFMVAIWGATLGKGVVGVVVVDKGDERCGWRRALTRSLLEYTYLVPLVWIISVIALALSKESRSPLDHTAGTRVVRRDSVLHLFARTTSVPETPLVSPRTHPGDYEQQLRQLARLRDDGLITGADFEHKKREILGL